MMGRVGITLATGLILALVACGRPATRLEGGPALTALPGRINFDDARPHDFGRHGPHRYPVHGIDVSRYQTQIDWPVARDNGVGFAFIKATEGGENLDPMFRDHWSGAAAAGVPRGAYHFYYHCRPAAEQARWFINNVPRAAGALPPVLDIEWTPFSPTCTLRPPAAEVRAEAQTFLAIVARHYGQRPIIYTSIDFYRDNQLWKVDGADFWLRSVAGHPDKIYDGQNWTFWQYTGTGLVPGIPGKADINTFAGSRSEWASWLQNRQL